MIFTQSSEIYNYLFLKYFICVFAVSALKLKVYAEYSFQPQS